MKLKVKHKIIGLAILAAVIPLTVMSALTILQKNQATSKTKTELSKLGHEQLAQIVSNVNGMCEIANSQNSRLALQTLIKTIYNIKVGKDGYVYVLGGKGDHKGYYIISKDGKRDGENIWDSKDADGNLFIQSIINKGSSLQKGEVAFEEYPWKNQGEAKARVKVAAITYYEPWDWVIGAGMYEEDYYEASNVVSSALNNLIKWSIIISLIGLGAAAIFAFFIGGKIASPIRKITEAAKSIAAGDLNTVIDIKQSDETGDLGSAMSKMVDNLRKSKEEIENVLSEANKKAQYLNNIPTPVLVVDKNMNIQFMNKCGADMAGLSPAECIGKKCYSLYTNPHCQTGECRVARSMQQDATFTGETLVTVRNMNLPIMYTGAPIKDEKGNIIGAFEYVNDITQIKKAQAKMEKVGKYQELEVSKISETLNNMAKGDLTVSYNAALSDDDTQQVHQAFTNVENSLRATLDGLNEILGHVATAVEQITSGAEQVSDSSQSLSKGATEQASSLEEITSSMSEMTSQTKQNADNATQANQLATLARGNAEGGNGQMKKMLDAMIEINQSSSQISKIIKAIDEIAFQTNLLALNAAVEAARAGVHGKGFAVVAEEVRNLAQRSAKAAKETTELIEGSAKKVENGTQIANETAKALEDIVAGITKVTDLVGEIAGASNEQAQGIEQVNQGLSQIDQITQSNTANAEESASAAEELSSQAVQLKQMLARFELNDQGDEETQKPAKSGFVNKAASHAGGNGRSKIKNDDSSWGGNGDSKKKYQPEAVLAINLDDRDFGKF